MPFKVVLVIIMVLWKGEKIVKKRGIFFRILVLSILSVIVLAGCQQNPEEGPKKVAQTYFDAVKMGDVEKAFSCYAPEVQQELDMGMDIASGISESASEKLFGFNVDATGIGSSFMGLAAAETYENYEFKATDVNFTDDEFCIPFTRFLAGCPAFSLLFDFAAGSVRGKKSPPNVVKSLHSFIRIPRGIVNTAKNNKQINGGMKAYEKD